MQSTRKLTEIVWNNKVDEYYSTEANLVVSGILRTFMIDYKTVHQAQPEQNDRPGSSGLSAVALAKVEGAGRFVQAEPVTSI